MRSFFSKLLLWLALSNCILLINGRQVFHFNTSNPLPRNNVPNCTDVERCEFICNGTNVCGRMQLHLYCNSVANCSFSCIGGYACGGLILHCPYGGSCEISANGHSVVAQAVIYASNSSSLSITAQGPNVLRKTEIHCPNTRSSKPDPSCTFRLIADSRNFREHGAVADGIANIYINGAEDLKFECDAISVKREWDLYFKTAFPNISSYTQTGGVGSVCNAMTFDNNFEFNCTDSTTGFKFTNSKCERTFTLAPTKSPTKSLPPTSSPSQSPSRPPTKSSLTILEKLDRIPNILQPSI